MNNQIIFTLQRKLKELSSFGEIDAETKRNALKEELQFFVLNFIYHHSDYSQWTMYGGSALRICHGLDRMSVDLDFEVNHSVSLDFLNKLKTEIEKYFEDSFNTDENFLTTKITNGRGLLLRFHIGDILGIDQHSKQVHVKIDLNYFSAPKTVAERHSIFHDQLSFIIKTYNMSALMASKIAAIFLRGQRGVGAEIYAEKGRDIYDLLWYMSKKIVPDLDYLTAKNIDAKNPRALFDTLTLQMNKVNDINLKQDLTPLFVDQISIKNWLKNWRESYLHLLADYEINTIVSLKNIAIYQDFRTDIFSFIFHYQTEEKKSIRIIYALSDYWIDFSEGNLAIEPEKKIMKLIEFTSSGITNHPASQDKLKQYATLFYQKNENYFKKTNRIILGDTIQTKLIRMTADKLNQKEQILLNKSTLLSCELDDLLK